MKQVNQKDADGNKIGVWAGHANNTSFEDTYKNGNLHGLSITRFPKDQIVWLEYFEHNTKEAESIKIKY